MSVQNHEEPRAVKIAVVGGFLGAGKTTSIVWLAKRLLLQGRRVGIVTNDQGSDLVDTEFLKSSGLPVEEVTGGCFCCNFEQFSAKLNGMTAGDAPEIILAEPVGSCTDLVATVLKPVGRGLAGRFTLAPLSVVVDPKRLRRVLAEPESPFPNEINYLFKKQIEEADVIAVNKADAVEPQELEAMLEQLRERCRGREILPVSARSGLGMEAWLERLALPQAATQPSLDIEYDAYAKAEAALGWLNTSCAVSSKAGLDGNAFLTALAEAVRSGLASDASEIAHLKLYLVSGSDFCKLSCTGLGEELSFDRRMAVDFQKASLVVNLRAEATPERLKGLVEGSLLQTAAETGAELSSLKTESFSPAYPRPRHRFGE